MEGYWSWVNLQKKMKNLEDLDIATMLVMRRKLTALRSLMTSMTTALDAQIWKVGYQNMPFYRGVTPPGTQIVMDDQFFQCDKDDNGVDDTWWVWLEVEEVWGSTQVNKRTFCEPGSNAQRVYYWKH